ncbi:hypothetical protein EYF80_004295 [Liparis tanakae]|uniref:Uncharacterized protein n=1 Tax=Liparis tanakae TaxID=230148 RepID=A0A4Z2J6T7_9TELE|nr:hypothetical protein EYF80_004295 [Liparis tanakae]
MATGSIRLPAWRPDLPDSGSSAFANRNHQEKDHTDRRVDVARAAGLYDIPLKQFYKPAYVRSSGSRRRGHHGYRARARELLSAAGKTSRYFSGELRVSSGPACVRTQAGST